MPRTFSFIRFPKVFFIIIFITASIPNNIKKRIYSNTSSDSEKDKIIFYTEKIICITK
jgi:hypothetical protein